MIAIVVLGAASAGALGCVTRKAHRVVTEEKPPPNVLTVSFERIALRTSAWVELHAWLAWAARSDEVLPDAALTDASVRYRAALVADPADDALGRATASLAACDDARCAAAALEGSPFARPYLDALPGFLEARWIRRSRVARGGLESAQAALGEELDPMVLRLARDLAIDWPRTPVVVAMVGEGPEAGPGAPIPVLLAARGGCFAGKRGEETTVHDARIVDCVLAYAARSLSARSEVAVALAEALRARGKGAEQDRAWTCLVVHAAAVVVTGLERRHVSVLRRSAAAALPERMAWLAREWPSRMRGEKPAAFAQRYAEAIASEAAP
ncbi:MAG: hypothetical protein JWP97_3426 [Labilithrix sp.]|nr:hypothetical protein [Labilithrix sp.]